MGKPLTWIERDRRKGILTAIGLGWAFVGLPLALLARSFNETFGLVVLYIVVAPIAAIAFAFTAFIALAPFFVRKPLERLVAAPVALVIGYALSDWLFAFGYLAAVLVVWAAVSAFRAVKVDWNKSKLPS